MGVLFPVFLFGAAAITLPIVLHLLRRDVAPERPFTAVRLLRRSPIERSRRRRLRDLLLLAARVAALLLLAIAFARPYLLDAQAGTGTVIVAIDRSFSMAAPGVFDRARAAAREAIDGASGGQRIALVAFDDRAQLVTGPGSSGEARAALDDLTPGSGGTRYGPVFARAAELAADGPSRLVLISDLQRAGFEGREPALPEGVALDLRAVQGPETNLSVDEVGVRDGRAYAVVRNEGSAARRTTARLLLDGREVVSSPIDVGAGASIDVPFTIEVPDSATLSVSSDDPRGYPADNARFAAPGSSRIGVLLVTGGPASGAGFYLSRALNAQGDEDAPEFDVHTTTGPALSSMSAADLERDSVVVLLSTQGIDRRARDALGRVLAAGGGVFVAAGPNVDSSVLSAALGWTPPLAARERADPGALAPTDLRHPIFRPFGPASADLGQVSFARAWDIADASSWRSVAEYTDGPPALLERRADAGRVMLFTSDLDRRWNDIPLHAAFVPFVQEMVRHLAGGAPAQTAFLVADVPADVPAQPGVVSRSGGHRAVVNVDPRESGVERLDASAFERSLTRTAPPAGAGPVRRAAQVEAQQSYWRYGLVLMLAALVAESFVGRPS
jgi:hypothetical protein